MKLSSLAGAILFSASLSSTYACYLGESCEDLQPSAVAQVQAVAKQNLSCASDADCTVTSVGGGGLCAAPCGILTNQSGAAAVVSAADSACSGFRDKGCPMPAVECPAGPPIICAGGTCGSFRTFMTPNPIPPVTVGVCTPLTLSYASSNPDAPDAPHDIAVMVSLTGGTLFSDPTCATPATDGSLTIPSGATSVAFGLVPTASNGFIAGGFDSFVDFSTQ